MIFFTSDLHFGHRNIMKYENRPFADVAEMDETLVANWNRKVGKKDSVYILGDVSFYHDADKTLAILERLNGKKYLILGNHDKEILKNAQLREQFEWIKDYYVLKDNDTKYVLFHYPIHVWDCKHHGARHLYGHIHSNEIDHHGHGEEMAGSLNVGTDCHNYFPISIREVEQMITERDKKEVAS